MAREKNPPKDSQESPGIFLRLSPAERQLLQHIVKRSNKKQTDILRRLVRSFGRKSLEAQDQILAEGDIRAISQAGSLMVRQAWLQHSFGEGYWHWAVEEAVALLNEAASVGSSDVYRFAHYRAAYCWLEIASGLRSHILSRLDKGAWDITFESADRALCASIAHNMEYSIEFPDSINAAPQTGANHPIITYNIACAWSLRAQYLLERSLGPTATQNRKTSKRLNEMERSRQEASLPLPPNGFSWPGEFPSQLGVDLKAINARAQQALDTLENIRVSNADGSPLGMEFIVRRSKDDTDLEILRVNRAFSDRFQRWQTLTGEDSLLTAYENSMRRLPQGIAKLVEQLAAF